MLGQLHDVDLQLLRLFVSVVECGGFSAAQGELGLSQSSISQQMARLETRLGYRLCSRGKSGFRITPKGEQLLIATRGLFESIEAFRHQSNGVAGRLIGEVRLGLSEAVDQSVLQRVAECGSRVLRRGDLFGRIGGEEFASLLPGCQPDLAEQIAERLQGEIQRLSFTTPRGERFRVTASFGLTYLKASDLELSALFARADAAMYRAKRLGKNQVIVA